MEDEGASRWRGVQPPGAGSQYLGGGRFIVVGCVPRNI